MFTDKVSSAKLVNDEESLTVDVARVHPERQSESIAVVAAT